MEPDRRDLTASSPPPTTDRPPADRCRFGGVVMGADGRPLPAACGCAQACPAFPSRQRPPLGTAPSWLRSELEGVARA